MTFEATGWRPTSSRNAAWRSACQCQCCYECNFNNSCQVSTFMAENSTAAYTILTAPEMVSKHFVSRFDPFMRFPIFSDRCDILSEDAFLPKKILFPLLAQGKPGFTRPGWLRLTRGSVKHLKHRKPFRFLAVETSCSYPGISQGHRSSNGGTYSKSRLNAGASMLSLELERMKNRE